MNDEKTTTEELLVKASEVGLRLASSHYDDVVEGGTLMLSLVEELRLYRVTLETEGIDVDVALDLQRRLRDEEIEEGVSRGE